jgi:hypothetical protein
VQIKMVANDTGRDLEIDGFKPMQANGDIICEAGIETGKIRSCAYTLVKGEVLMRSWIFRYTPWRTSPVALDTV